MKKHLSFWLLVIILLSSVMLPFEGITASDITNAKWLTVVTVTNNSSSTLTDQVVTFSLNSTAMLAMGFCDSSLIGNQFSDVAMVNNIEDIFQPGYTNTWCLFIPSISAGANVNYNLYSLNATSTSTRYFPGTTGMVVADGIAEPTDTFTITLTDCYINTTAGASKFVMQHYTGGPPYKGIKIFVSSTVSGNITATIGSAGGEFSTSLAGITTGEHDITLGLSGEVLTLTIDGVSSNIATGPWSVGDPSVDWTFCENDTVTYVNTIRYFDGGLGDYSWHWQYGATFTGLFLPVPATPSFRTTGTSGSLSAAVTSIQPVSQSKSTIDTTSSNLTVIDDPTAPSELYTEGDFTYIPGGVIVNALLDTSGIPRALWWYPFLFLLIGLIGMMIYGATSGSVSVSGPASSHMGSLLLQTIVCEVGLVLFAVMGAIPLFPVFIFPVGALAVILSTKHYGYG
jgi:hypothetical protein